MGKKNRPSDERIIAALLQHGTITAAAAAAGTTPRTIYDRMKEPEFVAAYSEAKAGILRGAVISLNGRISAAIDTIAGVMTDPAAAPATRLQAAQALLNNAGRFYESLDKAEQAQRRIRGNPLDSFF